jgi:hypothetical protein
MAASVNVRLAQDDRLYLKAISLVRREKESDMVRRVLLEFIDHHRGDLKVEKAREDAVTYGLVALPRNNS